MSDCGRVMERKDRDKVYARWRLLKTLAKLGVMDKVTSEMVRLYKLKKMWDSSYGQ